MALETATNNQEVKRTLYHFARACRSNKVSIEKVNQVGDSSDEENSEDEHVKKITTGWMSTDTGKKTTVKLLLNDVKVQMAIDSG